MENIYFVFKQYTIKFATNMKVKIEKDRAKIIHLPKTTVDGLTELAKRERTKCKPFMEKILIEFEKTKKGGKDY